MRTHSVVLLVAVILAGCQAAPPILLLEATNTIVVNTEESPSPSPAATATETFDPVVSPANVSELVKAHVFEQEFIVWSPQGHVFAKYNQDDTFEVRSLGETEPILETVEDIRYEVWSPDGELLATYSGEYVDQFISIGTIQVVDVETGEEIALIEGHENPLEDIVFSPDGGRIASVDVSGLLLILELESNSVIKLDGQRDYHLQIAWSPDGSLLAAARTMGYTGLGVDGTVRIYDASTGSVVSFANRDSEFVSRLLWSPDMSTLATVGDVQTTRVWEMPSGRAIVALEGETSAVWSFDGSSLITSGPNGITFWDAQTWQAVTQVAGSATLFKLSPNGEIVSFLEEGQIRLINRDGTNLLKLSAGEDPIRSFAWSPNGELLAAGTEAGRVLFWNASTWQNEASYETNGDAVIDINWSADGQGLDSFSFFYDDDTDEFIYTTIIWSVQQ